MLCALEWYASALLFMCVVVVVAVVAEVLQEEELQSTITVH